jgi:hypothetical protein
MDRRRRAKPLNSDPPSGLDQFEQALTVGVSELRGSGGMCSANTWASRASALASRPVARAKIPDLARIDHRDWQGGAGCFQHDQGRCKLTQIVDELLKASAIGRQACLPHCCRAMARYKGACLFLGIRTEEHRGLISTKYPPGSHWSRTHGVRCTAAGCSSEARCLRYASNAAPHISAGQHHLYHLKRTRIFCVRTHCVLHLCKT